MIFGSIHLHSRLTEPTHDAVQQPYVVGSHLRTIAAVPHVEANAVRSLARQREQSRQTAHSCAVWRTSADIRIVKINRTVVTLDRAGVHGLAAIDDITRRRRGIARYL